MFRQMLRSAREPRRSQRKSALGNLRELPVNTEEMGCKHGA